MADQTSKRGENTSLSSTRWHYIRQHPTLALSCTYLTASAMGMYSTWYKGIVLFGVNILPYAEPADFFFAALNKPLSLVIYVLLTVIAFGLLLLNEKQPSAQRWFDRIFMRLTLPIKLGLALTFVLAPVAFHSIQKAETLLCSTEGMAEVTIRAPVEAKKIVVVETTRSFVLGLEKSDWEGRCLNESVEFVPKPPLLVIPHSAIGQLYFTSD